MHSGKHHTKIPAAGFWREQAVCAYLQISRSSLRRLMATGSFPAPVRIGATIRWPVEEVIAYAEAAKAARFADEARVSQ